jgi:hypothetical protein
MKIKPFIALTAFAASMSAFAQATPTVEQGAQGRRLHSQAERQSLRRDVQAFHTEQNAAQPGAAIAQEAGRAAVQVEAPAAAPDAERLAKREHFERRKHHAEAREARFERREELQLAKEARLEKKEERRERRRHRAEPAPDAVTQ